MSSPWCRIRWLVVSRRTTSSPTRWNRLLRTLRCWCLAGVLGCSLFTDQCSTINWRDNNRSKHNVTLWSNLKCLPLDPYNSRSCSFYPFPLPLRFVHLTPTTFPGLKACQMWRTNRYCKTGSFFICLRTQKTVIIFYKPQKRFVWI